MQSMYMLGSMFPEKGTPGQLFEAKKPFMGKDLGERDGWEGPQRAQSSTCANPAEGASVSPSLCLASWPSDEEVPSDLRGPPSCDTVTARRYVSAPSTAYAIRVQTRKG